MKDSAELAVRLYIENYVKCRKLESEIYGSAPEVRVNRTAIRKGSTFVLSELYGLNLDESETRLCFRACRAGEPDAPKFTRFTGVFPFLQDLFSSVSDTVNNRGGALSSYSKCLAVPLFRYERASELKIAELTLNSVNAEYCGSEASLPFRELTSASAMKAYERANFSLTGATVAICDCGRRELDRYFSDCNIPRFKTNVSYRKDFEVITNSPALLRISASDLDAVKAYYLAALKSEPLTNLNCEPLTRYLSDPANLNFERECYAKL
ncbi:MAG: hypothetical protein LBN43_00565 [Oscillospiraceae bacterium]|jgi:hypothetical protein|nr:hypothetical protein [Oscillospiraceae bacterium]